MYNLLQFVVHKRVNPVAYFGAQQKALVNMQRVLADLIDELCKQAGPHPSTVVAEQ